MPNSLTLFAVIFALVPGYIADLAFRACWGAPKGDEFDRSLRALIWSALGLALFCTLLGGPPNYIQWIMPQNQSPVFDWRLGMAFTFGIALSALAAVGFGAFTAYRPFRSGFEKLFGRSPTFESPWDALWSRYDTGVIGDMKLHRIGD